MKTQLLINWVKLIGIIGFFVKNPNYPITQLIVLRTLIHR
jgi:hypothetical protein